MTSAPTTATRPIDAPGARSRWLAPDAPDPQVVGQLIQEARVPRVLARLLALRGHGDPDSAQAFLHARLDSLHDSSLMPGMADAIATLRDAHAKGETVGIHGDYDVDGITSVSFLVRALRRLGFTVKHAVPHRMIDGYGLSSRVLEAWAAEGIKTVLTCDVGVSNADVVADFGERHGMRFVITDHHRPPENLPKAAAVVDPILPGSQYPFAGLCGAGVALKVVMGLCKDMKVSANEVVGDLLDLVAIGTVADVVSLTDENRPIVKAGLQRLRQSANPGLRAMLEVSRIPVDGVNATTIGYRLGPQLNAIGRMDDANQAVELLLTDEIERALELAQIAFRLNEDRKEVQAKVLEAAEQQVRRQMRDENMFGLSVFGPGPESKPSEWWHPGVIGIVAGRIRETTGRPTMVFTWDGEYWKASGRAEKAEGFDLYEALAACGEHLAKFGGHAPAAGASLAKTTTPEAFAKAFDTAVRAQVGDREPLPLIQVDVEATVGELTIESVEAMALAEPFGCDNPPPKILLRGVMVDPSQGARGMRRIGSEGQYLKAALIQNGTPIEAIVFNEADHVQGILKEGPADIIAEIEINEWNNTRTVQARLLDACRAQAPDRIPRAPAPRELFRG